ncbi:ADP-ribosylation factor GTPase-activating protein AGD12 [Selaginella moellendorffii]|uniref:ADP-ribosylation factor GTPase-activating protein AGD12 n=1 Tax=Selaginella moellendorffii TaxID=88036 RepID=UPI000D1C3648|nr:ADP-ribosylation factor GTPase-activating protein AGD12 [Selaginella moellendorffii]|eukprot:XP_024533976.1 ADP-ribosylation factor GTPase-activating protein AGD12 [Selaginella moellendorffii]
MSLNSNDWTDEEVELMLFIGGNAAANAAYEAFVPKTCKRPMPDSSNQERAKFIRFRRCETRQKFKLQGLQGFVGLIRVRVIKGINLTVRDFMTSDPYVVLTLGNQKAQTCVVRSSLNPIWDEKHLLSVPHATFPLKLQVFDRDTFSEDDTMGDVSVDLQPLYAAVKVQEAMGDELGNVQVGKWVATRDNDLSCDSMIFLQNGRLLQDLKLKLKNVECGELEIQIEWIMLPLRRFLCQRSYRAHHTSDDPGTEIPGSASDKMHREDVPVILAASWVCDPESCVLLFYVYLFTSCINFIMGPPVFVPGAGGILGGGW